MSSHPNHPPDTTPGGSNVLTTPPELKSFWAVDPSNSSNKWGVNVTMNRGLRMVTVATICFKASEGGDELASSLRAQPDNTHQDHFDTLDEFLAHPRYNNAFVYHNERLSNSLTLQGTSAIQAMNAFEGLSSPIPPPTKTAQNVPSATSSETKLDALTITHHKDRLDDDKGKATAKDGPLDPRRPSEERKTNDLTLDKVLCIFERDEHSSVIQGEIWLGKRIGKDMAVATFSVFTSNSVSNESIVNEIAQKLSSKDTDEDHFAELQPKFFASSDLFVFAEKCNGAKPMTASDTESFVFYDQEDLEQSLAAFSIALGFTEATSTLHAPRLASYLPRNGSPEEVVPTIDLSSLPIRSGTAPSPERRDLLFTKKYIDTAMKPITSAKKKLNAMLDSMLA